MSMRIAMISEHASPLAQPGSVDSGGQNVYVTQTARHLAQLGYRVDVFTRRDRPDLAEIVPMGKGVRVIHVPAGPAGYVTKEAMFELMPAFAAWMAEFIRRQDEPYRLVHANFWMSGWVAVHLKRLLGLPFVITFHALGRVRRQHQGADDRFPDVRFAVEDLVAAEADRIIAECPQDQADLTGLYHADPGKISLAPCGFDPGEFGPVEQDAARRRLHLPTGEPVVLQLGRMVPRKGVDNVILGVAELIKAYGIPARLVIVGSDQPYAGESSELNRLARIADDAGIRQWVSFMGQQERDRLKDYYNAADVFVTTPWYEPFGITPVEAMACGTPVIGANVGGIKYTVLDGVTGYLVPPKDPVALAARLADLLSDPDRRARFSRQALRRANELFTWQQVALMLSMAYQDVLDTQAGYSRRRLRNARPAFSPQARVYLADAPALRAAGDGKNEH
jgi:glycosyltransferase involved in cell wall biosynthesis